MSRLFIDVTNLIRWQGRLTGIPRVEYELVSRFARDDAVFIRWGGDNFYFADANEVLSRECSLGSTEPNIKFENNGRFGFGKLKQQLGKSKYLRKAYHGIHYKKLPINNMVHRNAGDVVTPSRGDTLFIGLGLWSDDGYIQKIVDSHANGVKIVQVAYDMLPIIAPQYSGHSTDWLKKYAESIYPICDIILSISENTKKDINAWMKKNNMARPVIKVFRLGDNFKISSPVAPVTVGERLVKGGYILCVGTVEARKNHALLYYAYKRAVSKKISLPKMVIVGRRGWRAGDIFDIITTDPETCNTFIMLEDTSDEELAWLYGNCAFSIYPSFYEGWGLPIAESMYYGVPCICSNTSSMPEVAGDLVNYFDPTSPDEALNQISRMLSKDNLDEARARAKSYKMTSWDDSYEQIIGYLRGLL